MWGWRAYRLNSAPPLYLVWLSLALGSCLWYLISSEFYDFVFERLKLYFSLRSIERLHLILAVSLLLWPFFIFQFGYVLSLPFFNGEDTALSYGGIFNGFVYLWNWCSGKSIWNEMNGPPTSLVYFFKDECPSCPISSPMVSCSAFCPTTDKISCCDSRDFCDGGVRKLRREPESVPCSLKLAPLIDAKICRSKDERETRRNVLPEKACPKTCYWVQCH